MPTSSVVLQERGFLEGRRILIVEDEYFLADDIARACRERGAEVEGPIGGIEEALAIVDGRRLIDGAVLDVNLRTNSIFPVARALRSRAIPFIFATGYDRSAIEPEFADIPLWEKPLDLAALTRGLGALMHKP